MSDYYECCDGTLYTAIDDSEWTCCSAGGTVYVTSCTSTSAGSYEECLSGGHITRACCPAGRTLSEVSFSSDYGDLQWSRTCM